MFARLFKAVIDLIMHGRIADFIVVKKKYIESMWEFLLFLTQNQANKTTSFQYPTDWIQQESLDIDLTYINPVKQIDRFFPCIRKLNKPHYKKLK